MPVYSTLPQQVHHIDPPFTQLSPCERRQILRWRIDKNPEGEIPNTELYLRQKVKSQHSS